LLLAEGDFSPIPTYPNKHPACNDWQTKFKVGRAEIELWPKVYPDAKGTGVLTAYVPAFDVDIMIDPAAQAIEDLVRERFDEQGPVLVRFGRPPKRAIPFRCDQPFAVMKVPLIAPDGSTHKLEFLGNGQHLMVAGLHGDSGRYYRWHGSAPGRVRREELPCINAEQARQLIDEAAELLVRDFDFKIGQGSKANGANGANGADGQPADWETLVANIISGADFHRSLTSLAASCIARGFGIKKSAEFLRGLMQCHQGPHDARWKDRYNEIAPAVKLAHKKYDPEPPAQITVSPTTQTTAAPKKIDEVLAVFRKWLLLSEETLILAALGTVAANLLDGDPVWLGIIGPPSNAKTEILASLNKLPFVAQAATLSPAGLLSGTPRRQRHQAARGGLLNQIGNFGILVLKDFGSILQMHPEKKAELLAALREIYDGSWTRVLGTDGGRVLSWVGKLGLRFAATRAIDSHHAVIGSMGDRWLLTRIANPKSQFKRAIQHKRAKAKQMRDELADAVAGLFAASLPQPRETTEAEIEEIDKIVELAVHMRGAIERDRYSREVEMVLGAEGTGRIGLALEQLLSGLDALGVERAAAMNIVRSVAFDSVPPARRRAYEFLRDQRDLTGPIAQKTSQVARALRLPTNTVRRVLQDLTAYDLIERIPGGKKGTPDTWVFK
jgi:hypothetical protein